MYINSDCHMTSDFEIKVTLSVGMNVLYSGTTYQSEVGILKLIVLSVNDLFKSFL